MSVQVMGSLFLCVQPGIEFSRVDIYQPDGTLNTVKPNEAINCFCGSRVVLHTVGEYKWNVITTDNEIETLGCTQSIQFTVPMYVDSEDSFLYIDGAKAWPAMECNLVLSCSQGWVRDVQPVLNSDEILELSFDVKNSSYIYKIKTNRGSKTYTISDTIPCTPGDKITLCHSSNKSWVVNSNYNADIHMNLGMNTFCSFIVPAKVFGTKAKLLTGSTKDYDYLALNRSIGWIRDISPQIGI